MTGREQGEIQPKTSRSIEIAHEHEQRHEHEAQVVNMWVIVCYGVHVFESKIDKPIMTTNTLIRFTDEYGLLIDTSFWGTLLRDTFG